MQFTLQSDSFGRAVGTIEHNAAHASVTASDAASALEDLKSAIESAAGEGLGECFWHEAAGDYRWLFRREGDTMRVAILWSIGTMTGWEHRFWAECDTRDFLDAMHDAFDACGMFEARD